jgi:peptidoglycan/xylan/chitin deacetylase (PgdA/CDA1 family)
MYKVIVLVFIICISVCDRVAAQLKVVLKLDDIGAQRNSCKALPVMEYLLARNVKASYGVIANRLDDTAQPLLAKIINAKDKQGKPMVEIWNHGLDHSKTGDLFEFKGTSYRQQKLHLDSSHFLVKKYLNVDMVTFGAPYNQTDSVCLKVLSDSRYKKVFYSRIKVAFKTDFDRLNNSVAMEKETGKPDFDYFMVNYNKSSGFHSSNIILQGHPPYWTEEGFAEFKKILDFLDTQKCVYVLPASLK